MFRATHRSSSGAQKNVIAASGFTYVCSSRPLWWLSSHSAMTAAGTTNLCKTRGCNYSLWDPDDEWCVARNML